MTRMANFKALREDAILPRYAYPGDAGMDFAIVGDHDLSPGESRDLPSGIAVELPPGYWCRITGRSSTLRKYGLFVNEGVIDAGYRGELLTYVTNRQSTPVHIEHGTRLAQLILSEVIQTDTRFVPELSESQRGTKGFGSTGKLADVLPDPKQMTIQDAVAPAGMADRYEVYLGGPVDYGDPASDYHQWRHEQMWSGLDVYCPICMNRDDIDIYRIVARNTDALAGAAAAVFDLRMIHHSIGTPVEIEQYLALGAGRAYLVHPFPESKRGIFVRWWEARGAVVVSDFQSAASAARLRIAQVSVLSAAGR